MRLPLLGRSHLLTCAQPKKTPKVTKLNGPKTPNGEASAKKSSSKPKKKVTAPKEDAEEQAKPQMTEEERLEQREKAILYLRHRLQKGFLSRDQAPQEGEMGAMAEFFSQLENYENLEPAIIRKTKIHKVLKAIVKLSTIQKNEDFNFKKRSAAMLEVWNKRMEADGGDGAAESKEAATEDKEEAAAAPAAAPTTNGEKTTEAAVPEPAADAETKEGAEKEPVEAKAVKTADKIEEKVESEVQPKTDAVKDVPDAVVEQTDPGNDAKDEATDGDVTMDDAPKETAAAAAS